MKRSKKLHMPQIRITGKTSKTCLILYLALGAVTTIVLAGTLAFVFFADMSPLRALYHTVNVISTLGEEEPLRSTAGRVITILLIVLGAAAVAFAVSAMASVIVSMEIRNVLGRRNMKAQIAQLNNHIVVCGYGRMGQQICEDFKRRNCSFVVVDHDPQAIEEAEQHECYTVKGRAHDEETLREAGIEKARGLVSVLTSDADNVFVTLTARDINHNLYIVVRAENEDTVSKMRKAGANAVVSPFASGARQISMVMTNPAVAEFFADASQGENLEMIELVAPPAMIGLPLEKTGLRESAGVLVISIKHPQRRQIVAPSSHYIVQEGDRLLCVGENGARQRVETMVKNALQQT